MAIDNDEQMIQKTLGKAGGGLPKREALLLKYAIMPTLRTLLDGERAVSIFESEGEKILKLAKQLSHDELFTRVLIPKVFAIEDNSRYYSVAMVLWHLVYVGEAIQNGVIDLSHGKDIELVVKIENFKPFVEIGGDIVERFESFLSGFGRNVFANAGDINSLAFHRQPWFGELNPKGWLVLAMAHQLIHRRQIEVIVWHSKFQKR